MNIEKTDRDGITVIKITKEIAENGILWRLNQGLLHRNNMRIEFKEKADGTLEFYLLTTPTDWAPFGYSDEADAAMETKWNNFVKQIR